MPLTQSERDKLWEDHVAMIEEEGGVGAIMDEMEEFQELLSQFLAMDSSLVKRYPDKWVAMGKGGVIAVGDSATEALDNLEELGLDRSKAVCQFMNTNPPILIL